MPNHHHQRQLKRPHHIVALLPLSSLSFALAASAQTTSSEKESAGSVSTATPAPHSSAPSFSRGSSAGTTPTPPVSEVTIEEPPPGFPANTPPSFYGASGSSGTSSLGVPGFAATTPSVQSPMAPTYPLQWGPLSFHPHLAYGFVYAEGVLVTPGQPTTTASHSVSPGLTILSRHLSFDYTPSLVFYSRGPYENTVNHSASLGASFAYGDWTFHLSQSFQDYSTPLIETGFQTDTLSFGTAFGATWNFNEKWFFDFTLSQQRQDNSGFQSSRQYSTMEWANYRITRQLSVGAGLGGGYTDVDAGSDSTFEQIQGRVNWHPSKKLSLNLNGGVEIRQFLETPGSDSLINPIMGASIYYQLFEATSVSISANRSVDTSLFANQITENAGISVAISQRLLKYLNLGVSAGYRRSNYKNTAFFFNESFITVRQDDYTFVSTSLGMTFLKKASASIGYTHGDNQSNFAGYTYASDQVSFNLGYRF